MARYEYPACSHLNRHSAPITVDEGWILLYIFIIGCLVYLMLHTRIIFDTKKKLKSFLETIKQEARVLPLYEERIHKFKYTRGYSLNNNEMLKCRWTEFTTTRKPKIPFNFPSVNDMHFYKNTVMHAPKESVQKRENHRFHLRSGPGIDRFGQVPIPNEMQFRKSAYHEIRPKNTNKNGIDKTEEKKTRS